MPAADAGLCLQLSGYEMRLLTYQRTFNPHEVYTTCGGWGRGTQEGWLTAAPEPVLLYLPVSYLRLCVSQAL